MATNTFLLRFDEFELAEIKRLITSPQGSLVEFELDYLYMALCDLKAFAKNSLDQNDVLIDEAFAQFEWNSSTSILRRSFAILGFDIYRNLAHIHGAKQSIFAVLSQPLSFFNECIDNLFSWLVRDLKCTIFREAWDAWLAYKDHCEEFGIERPGDEPLDRKNKIRTDQLLRKMARAFDDLKNKKLPRISSAPRHFTEVGGEIDHLLVDGSDLLNSDPTISLPICFTKLSEYLNSCIYCKTWGIFGEKLFIQLICTLKSKDTFDISPEESNRLDGLWIETRSSFINFLERLKNVTNSNILSEFYEWLNEHKYLALPSQANCSRRQLNACILKELPDWCRNLILDICEETILDLVRDAYAGTLWENFDRFDMPEVIAQGRGLQGSYAKITEAAKDEIITEIHNRLNELPDKQDLRRNTHKILKALEGADEHEEHKNGPLTKVRAEQIQKVKDLLNAAIKDKKSLSLHGACKKAWEPLTGGYPTPKSLYQYCHEHKYEFPVAD